MNAHFFPDPGPGDQNNPDPGKKQFTWQYPQELSEKVKRTAEYRLQEATILK